MAQSVLYLVPEYDRPLVQARALHANSSLPLLVGPQGCGKSTWCRNLLPPSLRMYYTDSIDFSNKRDAELMLTRFALINIDEFDSVSSAYQSFLKNVLQKPVVNARQPYKRSIQALHRYASFIATCNNYDLLTDRPEAGVLSVSRYPVR